MPISIYPPILKSTQAAFLSTTVNYPVYFTLLKQSVKDEIKHILIRVTKQTTNRTIVNTSSYPDGIIYKNINFDTIGTTYNESNTPIYYVPILSTDLLESWQPGYLYKIQARFGKTAVFDSVGNFATWKQEQIEKLTFSEWSTVMVIKAIREPTVYIQNAEETHLDVIESERTEETRTPLFTGVCNYPVLYARYDYESNEAEDTYRFALYKGDSDDEADLLEDTGWLQHNAMQDSVDYCRFNLMLDNQSTYTVTYEIKTVNGYEDAAEPYTFIVNESNLARIEGVTFEVDDSDVYCTENGCVNIYLTTEQEISGCYVIARSSEKTNFSIYEDIKFLLFSKKLFIEKTLIFLDFTIESGVKYRYTFLLENSAGLRTTPLFEDEEESIYRMVNFEYAFLYRDDVQLRLKFNNNMSSFKHTVLTSKQDTLGDKYPHLVKNGYAYYAEFPVTGLISLEMDTDLTFFLLGSDGYYFRDELVIPSDKYLDSEENYLYDRDLTHDNIFIERIFREKTESFLNDFEYKLYKSPTEGNIVVVLTDVSLTPQQALGRMIFEFSATAYEVLENTVENLNEYGIIDIGEFMSLATEETVSSFGQASGLFIGRLSNGTTTDLLEEIRKIEEVSISGGYKTVVKKIRALRIEQYPLVDFEAELAELNALRSIALNNGEDTSEIDAEIAEYEELGAVLASTPETKNAIIELNGKEIIMGIGKVYWLDDIDEDITSLNLKYTMPIIVNYVCDLVQREDDTVGVISAVDTSRIWGLVSGIFTTTDSILKNYDLWYKDSPTFRIYNPYPDDSIVYGIYGDVVLDNTTINVYKSLNLFDIIQEETKRQVEVMYGISDGFETYDDTTKQWNSGNIYYTFNSLYLFDIEADPGTMLYIGLSADGSDKTPVIIGPTGRYILNPSDSLVEYAELAGPQFAIINYKCLTSLMIMTKKGE